MRVELGDDAIYVVKGSGSISLQMPLGDVLELNDVLFVLGLMKNLCLVSCMIDLHCVGEFDPQKVIIRDRAHVVAKSVRVGGLYRLQVDQDLGKESLVKDTSLPSTSTHQMLRWLTQTLEDVHEHA
jgi:hypothetical protein